MTLKSFSLGIIDLLGIMVPGVVWVGLLFYFHFLYPNIWVKEFTLASKEAIQYFPENSFLVNCVVLLFSSYVVGYLSRLAPPRLLDRITIPIAFFGTGERFSKVHKLQRQDKIAPYDFLYKHQAEHLRNMESGSAEFSGVSNYFQMFFLCKRLILQYAPNLWADAERREAEIRLINGLFYAVFFSFLVFTFQGDFLFACFALLLTVFLAVSFRRRRYAEVSFVYSSTYIVLKDLENKKKNALHGA